MQRFKKYAIGAGGMLVLVAVVVLATGSGSAVAAQITSVLVTNDTSHPVPVAQQGTANVNVTNASALQVSDHTATQVLYDGPGVDGAHRITLDTSHSREIRVYANGCDTDVDVRVVDAATGVELPTIDCSATAATAVYEVPGTSIVMWMDGSGLGAVHLVVYSRSN
jgi:hypothetical protein